MWDMATRDHLGRSPEQAARERAEIRRYADQEERARARSADLWQRAYDSIESHDWIEADCEADEAEKMGLSREASFEAALARLRETRDERAYSEFARLMDLGE